MNSTMMTTISSPRIQVPPTDHLWVHTSSMVLTEMISSMILLFNIATKWMFIIVILPHVKFAMEDKRHSLKQVIMILLVKCIPINLKLKMIGPRALSTFRGPMHQVQSFQTLPISVLGCMRWKILLVCKREMGYDNIMVFVEEYDITSFVKLFVWIETEFRLQ